MATVSVLSPVFNEARFIEAAMRSVVRYDGENDVEYVLVDDGSTDGSLTIMETLATELSGENPKIQFLLCKNPGKGKNAALNYAYELATGQVLVLFAGDDLICAENLDGRARPLLKEDGPAITQAALEVFLDGQADQIRRVPVAGGGNQSGGALAMNRQFAQHYFPLPENLPNEDTWSQAVIMATRSKVISVDLVALAARVHDNNSWNRSAKFAEYHQVMSRRNLAYEMAREKFGSLGGADTARLDALCKAEAARRKRQPLAILFMSGLTLREKRHFLVGASQVVFDLKAMIQRSRK